ncbi:MAG TPA: AbgT family transporter [Gaiellaceae bacterium]|jgi:aminobenzoyl-glutamate transport protein|nr:AbgT family transporter [Gaiellaceae bacterium]
MSTIASEPTPTPDNGFMAKMLDGIERLGNKMPDPAILFLWLCAGVIVLSQILYWFGVKATFQVVTAPPVLTEQTYYGGSTEPTDVGPTQPVPAPAYHEETQTAKVKGLLTGEGVRYLFTSFVSNFRNFAAVAIILVVMIGVGLAEAAGLIGALIRKLVGVSSKSSLTFIIVLLGIISSIASDAGYLVLIPLGAAAFLSVGRHPLAGIAAAFAGVAAGFGVNFLITPLDGVLTEITNDAAGSSANHIDLAANLYFGIGSTIFVAIVLTFVSAKFVENRLGTYNPADAGEGEELDANPPVEISPEDEARGLRYAGLATLAVVVVIALLTVIPGAPLRNPITGSIIGDSPFMDSLIVIITMIFFAAGLAFGYGANTIKGSAAILGSITKSWSGLASLLFLFLLIAQFIAYFNFTNIAEILAVKLGDWLERANIGTLWLLIGLILITIIVNLIIPQAIAKWALLAPIFIPLFLRLNVAPQTVLAAYRIGDSPTNVITPLMAYFPLIVIFTKRYRKDAGIGTIVSMMIPYVVILSIAWILFFIAWYLLDIPLGPGSPVHLH